MNNNPTTRTTAINDASRSEASKAGLVSRATASAKRFGAYWQASGKAAFRRRLMGGKDSNGILLSVFLYFMAVVLCFVFLYPIFCMSMYSLMSVADVVNPVVLYLPTEVTFANYTEAMRVLDFWSALMQTALISLVPSLLQVVSTSLIGYGLARFKFYGRSVLLILVLATFVIPPQITMIPQLNMFRRLMLIDTVFAYILPAAFGQGIRSAIFILIFWQYFRSIPQSLEEAAQIDGAGYIKIFVAVAVPTALPAYLVAFLFSLVWYYNETTLANLYFGDSISTLPMQLERFRASYEAIFGIVSETGKSVNEAIYLAGVLLTISPLLLVYAFLQRRFVESIDKTGITGE